MVRESIQHSIGMCKMSNSGYYHTPLNVSISAITIDTHPIYTIEVASKLMHYTPMTTLMGSSSEALRRLGFMKPGCRKYQP